jgi:hypothetical protein
MAGVVRLVPITVIVTFAGGALGRTHNVRFELTDPPIGGVIGFGVYLEVR